MKSKLRRIDIEFEKKLEDIMKERYSKGLARMNVKELNLPEVTRLLLRAPSWQNVEKELRTLPKRKDR